MATSKEIVATAHKLEEIPRALDTCEQVAKALIDTGQKWRSEDRRSTTDFDRARNKVIGDLMDAELGLLKIRESEFSPDAIRATACVLRLRAVCEQCPELNLKSLKENKPFTCMAREQLGNAAQGFRFKLDAKGSIVESR